MAKPAESERLEALFEALTDPRRGIGSIAQLAAAHGFDDLAEFNRLFREKYGNPPAVVRKAVRKGKVRFGAAKR